MSSLKDYWVSATDDKGLVVYTQEWRAVSAIMACAQAEADMRRDNVQWHTVWTGDPARPDFMKTTKEG